MSLLAIAPAEPAGAAPLPCGSGPGTGPSATPDDAGYRQLVLRPFNRALWIMDCKNGPASNIEDADAFELTTGGIGSGTHYARLRRFLPEFDDFAPSKELRFTVEFTLPEDFYSQMTNPKYLRIVATDNHCAKFKSGGYVGSSAPGVSRETCVENRTDAIENAIDEWRVGLAIEGSTSPRLRLVSVRDGDKDRTDNDPGFDRVLWEHTEVLATEVRHRVDVVLKPAHDQSGSWKVTIDGVASSGTGQTVPKTVPAEDMVITRVSAGIDGAYSQNTRTVTLRVHALTVSTK